MISTSFTQKLGVAYILLTGHYRKGQCPPSCVYVLGAKLEAGRPGAVKRGADARR
jgi:hypothetical protein